MANSSYFKFIVKFYYPLITSTTLTLIIVQKGLVLIPNVNLLVNTFLWAYVNIISLQQLSLEFHCTLLMISSRLVRYHFYFRDFKTSYCHYHFDEYALYEFFILSEKIW